MYGLSFIMKLAPATQIITSYPTVFQNTAISVSVCFSDHSRISEVTCPNFNKKTVHVTCSHGSILPWWQCNMLCISSFMNDLTFSHNGANSPKSKTTRMFHGVHHEGEAAVYDCRVVNGLATWSWPRFNCWAGKFDSLGKVCSIYIQYN